MLDSVRLKCPSCRGSFNYSVSFIEGQIKAMKIHKRDEVAQQMYDKSGPFYDRWVAAMAARGPQERCTDCLWLFTGEANPRYFVISCYGAGRRDGQFACGHYIVDPLLV